MKKTPLKAKTPLKGKKNLTNKPKTTISRLKRKADAVFSLYVRLRDSNDGYWGACITCDMPLEVKKAQAGHFMSRRFNNTRYEEENVNMQCYRCNVAFNGEQYKYAIALEKKYGDGTAEKLAVMSAVSHPFKKEELQQIISDSEEQIEYYKKLYKL